MTASTRKTESSPQILYCIYARKSMEAEERQALSIDSQLNEMKVISDRDKLRIVATKTESHSAKDSGQRPVFNEVIADLKKGVYNAILTWNPDRLSRNAGDLGQLVDLMDKGLLREIRTYGQIFTNSPNDKFLLMILCSQAKYENDNKGINVRRGLRARCEMGLYPSVAPLGYLDPKLRDNICLKELDPDRAPIVKMMFEKVAYEKLSTRAVLRWLRSIDFRSPGGVLIGLSNVQAILKRHFYYGEFEYPKGSGNWYKGKHEPIITKELFDEANNVIAQRQQKRRYLTKTSPFMFLRMIRCGTCGSGISAQEKYKKNKTTDDIHIYRYYVCSRSRDRDCFEPVISEDQLMVELQNVLDRVDIDLIGMRSYLDIKIEKWYSFHSFVTKLPVPERDQEWKEHDVRKAAQVIFDDGTIEEKREILKHLKGRLILKNKKIYTDSIE